jgi:hypothetical protein
MATPITDTIIAAVAQIVDDSKTRGEYREPTHSDIDFYVQRTGLTLADPKSQGQTVGKAKRVRAILSWAIDNNAEAGSRLIDLLMSKVRASGGFREESNNYVGAEAILNAINAFETEGFSLSKDGQLLQKVLENLSGKELTSALAAYARRAQKGAEDAALLSGTGKDLLEATAAHIIQSKWGSYPTGANFQSLMGQAYMTLGLTVPEQEAQTGEAQIKGFERAMFQTACAINRLRNKEGTGHGRPWLTSISQTDARASVEMVGCIAGFLINKLNEQK